MDSCGADGKTNSKRAAPQPQGMFFRMVTIREENRAQGTRFMNITQKMDRNRNNAAISINRDITCLYCGKNGLMDIHDEADGVSDGRLFRHLGHNPFSGDLHYQCPACGIVLLVDPMLALGEKQVSGRPHILKNKTVVTGTGVFHGFISALFGMVFPDESEEFYFNASTSNKKH